MGWMTETGGNSEMLTILQVSIPLDTVDQPQIKASLQGRILHF